MFRKMMDNLAYVRELRLERDAWRALAHVAAEHPELAKKAGL
jgi:hypothetical protein